MRVVTGSARCVGERRPDVSFVVAQVVEEAVLVSAAQPSVAPGRKLIHVVEEARLCVPDVSVLGQALPGECGHRFEQMESGACRSRVGDDERLFSEPVHDLEHDIGRDRPAGDGDHCIKGEAPSENSQSFQHQLLVHRQEGVGPLDAGFERPVSRLSGPVSGDQETESISEPIGDPGRGKQVEPRGSKLDGQRQAIHAPADLGHV